MTLVKFKMTENQQNNFSNKIKQLRVDLGLTQEQLAEKTGLSVRSLVRYEQGERIPKGAARHAIDRFMTEAATNTTPQPSSDDPSEFARLRTELAQERKEHEALQALYSEVVKHRNEMREVMEGLYLETQVLSKEIESLRLQASASSLTPADARLITEIAEALGVPAKKGLRGVLQRVRANLASAGVLTGAEGKDGGDEA